MTKGHPEAAEVTEIYKDQEVMRHVVYLTQHICTCREWQVTRKPYPHALAVITTLRQPNIEQYVDKYYSVEKLRAAYQGVIPMITDREQWPEVDKGFKLHPPTSKKPRPPGRQKKNKYPAPSEKKGKATRQVICPTCNAAGHKKGSWRCPLTRKKKKENQKVSPKAR